MKAPGAGDASASISDIVDRFKLSGEKLVPAIIVARKKEPEPITLRRSNRVKPPVDGSLGLSVQNNAYVIFDISLHGINFIQPKDEEAFPVSSVVELTLAIDEKPYKLRATVVRTAEKEDGRYNSLDFTGISGEAEEILGIKLFSVEMQSTHLDGHLEQSGGLKIALLLPGREGPWRPVPIKSPLLPVHPDPVPS